MISSKTKSRAEIVELNRSEISIVIGGRGVVDYFLSLVVGPTIGAMTIFTLKYIISGKAPKGYDPHGAVAQRIIYASLTLDGIYLVVNFATRVLGKICELPLLWLGIVEKNIDKKGE